jgi:metal-responsive CopG/Arc/MetJ family transcriptional regulator
MMEVVMQYSVLDKYETVRTTVTLPANLLQRSQELVESGQVPNRNALIVAALEQFIADLERAEIDRQFAAMADDADYQALQTEVAESFADADWEALTEGEQALE